MRPEAALTLLALGCAACAADARSRVYQTDDIWQEPPSGTPDAPAIDFQDRESGVRYGLPREGQKSIADLIALFPRSALGVNDPNIFVAPGIEVATDQCNGGDVVELPGLPVTVEGVVTLFPREYLKLPICGQDERHYGVFTLEDDTGGLIVLRDSRVATFDMGDRVRLKVSGITLTYGRDLDTRAVLIADIEDLGNTGPVLYERATRGFTADDTGEVRRVEGFVAQVPDKDNFNQLVLTPALYEGGVEPGDLTGNAPMCSLSCEGACTAGCGLPSVCRNGCASLCQETQVVKLAPEDVPTCWMVGLGSELGKRGLTYPLEAHLRVTGPVVNSYDRQIWVLDPGQVETLGN